ncbi:MAG: hypothetical protein QUS12_11510 [Methanosarcina sp.]|nr:hypothetical protein [Methanosarcina sp.]
MEKIVVMSGGTDQDSNLIACLKALFPECEIDIQNREPANYDSFELSTDDSDTVELNEDLEKYLSFL